VISSYWAATAKNLKIERLTISRKAVSLAGRQLSNEAVSFMDWM